MTRWSLPSSTWHIYFISRHVFQFKTCFFIGGFAEGLSVKSRDLPDILLGNFKDAQDRRLMGAMWLSVVKFRPLKVGIMSSYLNSSLKAFLP
jgi:hypothetical protein